MKSKTFFAIGILAVGLAGKAGAQGQDQFAYGIAGGVSIPSGQGADNHKAGPDGALMIGFGSVDSPFGVRLDVMYGGLGSKTGAGTQGLGAAKVTNVNANFLFTLVGSEHRTYFVGGAGGYNYNPDGPGTRATNDFAINAGLGLWFPEFNGFVEARWFNMYRALPDPVTGFRGKKSLRIFPINIGFMF